MRDLLELGTGQVAFLSGLLSGFALTAAIHVLHKGLRDKSSQIVFLLLVLTTLLFLVSLYTDVRLTIELAGRDNLSTESSAMLADIRRIGTNCATWGFAIFLIAIGLLGWIATPGLGVLTTLAATAAFSLVAYIWYSVYTLFSSI